MKKAPKVAPGKTGGDDQDFNVALSPALIKRLKQHKLDTNGTLKGIVTAALEQYLAKKGR